MERLESMLAHPLFAGVETLSMGRVLAEAKELTAARGEHIYTPRHFHRCLGILLSGRVQVSKESLIVSVLSDGDVFGAAALFTEQEDYATTLTAMSDCALILIPQEVVLRLLRECPQFAENYVRYLTGRIQFLSDRLDTVSAATAEGKLSQYLLSVAGQSDRVSISATQLSARIGVGRATLYRAFETLEREGVIAREGKTIRILSREKLES